MPAWACDECGAKNRASSHICEQCGDARPRSDAPVAPAVCGVDGTPLMANGFCPKAEGFPVTRSCPFACPRCRGRLSWAGTCLRCPAAAGAPGDRYELRAGHWVLVLRGPQRLCTREENRQAVAVARGVLQRRRTVDEAHAAMAAALPDYAEVAAQLGEPIKRAEDLPWCREETQLGAPSSGSARRLGSGPAPLR